MSFKKDFMWGAATAAYQIEGAHLEDGKGLSVWDVCSHKPGFVKGGHTGDIACDHYHRYKEDVALMKELSMQAYRFSISWPRVLPSGTGKINEKGLDFYDRLVDELLAQGIEPFVTLFHWDYPNELFLRGGFLNPDSSDWFQEYTRVVVERLSDRVTNWMTLNEPQCFSGLGYQIGAHAPGLQMDNSYVLRVIHNMLLSHGKAVQTIRSYSKKQTKVGYAPVLYYIMPASNKPEDIELAKQQFFSCKEDSLFFSEPWWNEPIFYGKYPEDGLKIAEKWLPGIENFDISIAKQPLDFFGFNFYRSETVAGYDSEGKPFVHIPHAVGHPHTAFDWEITPEGMYYIPKALYEKYQLPLLVTENGLSNTDWVDLNGEVKDPQRIDFLHRYLKELKRAAADGVDIMGYMHWSFMDNFEWAEGYNERFGLVHVDYETQKRTPKSSAYWYKNIILTNGEQL
ncbi:GH1 family beta-glucosidase [Anaeromicropila populeti]|uniref:Beta-glucosidase n=1 Tax=Anaeromicropila populeti TaxID=37658 RepID=A0A1I6KH72_9FIRM|nr:GH1 family beta-glucosidase [Anaeromicropila populeti]SFR90579.1 beta-glucosidase [Anaeromicropila populeti]